MAEETAAAVVAVMVQAELMQFESEVGVAHGIAQPAEAVVG
jgi:hypothetical protein